MIIIPQTKGGVGKSTVAMQVIAPYLYKKHGKKVTYIEIDDENNDSRSFTRTEIVNKKMLEGKDVIVVHCRFNAFQVRTDIICICPWSKINNYSVCFLFYIFQSFFRNDSFQFDQRVCDFRT